MEFHEVASIFPMMSAEEFAALKADIQASGLLEPIWTYQNSIIDGRNRYNACIELGIKPSFREWDGNGSLKRFVVSLNLIRRHLDETQRGMCAARAANMEVGNPNFTNCRNSDNSVSQGDAADMFNVSRDTVNCAAKVIDGAEPEIIELCDNGRMAASAAASIADAPAEFQKKVAELIETGEAKSGKDAIRLARRAEVAEIPDLPTGKYRVIYADPPWKYGDELTENYGATRYHYPPQTISELCEGIGDSGTRMPVEEIAEESAVLFLWVTSPLLEDAFKIIKAWGFKYKASFVWDKIKHNMGHYNSVRHEFLLVCTRGSCLPDVGTLFDSVQAVERSDRHSEKPKLFREIIDQLYPHGNRIELFARSQTEGWEIYGNQLG